MSKLIITAAVVGSRPTRSDNPAVPYSPKEIAAAIVECYEAGAAIAHVHVRDPETGAPSDRIELFGEVLERVRAECPILVNLTTSGLNVGGEDSQIKRLEPVHLSPDICSLDIGSLNFADGLFANPPDFGIMAAETMKAKGVKPEIEVFDVGHIAQASHMIKEGYFEAPAYFQLCMGVRWGIEATPENLLFMKNKLPAGSIWSVLGVGRHQLTMITMAMLLGGHIRVGFEDNLFLKKGVLAKSNAEFVEVAAQLALQLRREVATPEEAKEILGM